MAKTQIQEVETQPLALSRMESQDSGSQQGSYENQLLIRGLMRRWYILLISMLVICAIGTPLIWRLIQPKYRATAAVRVAPIIPAILFSDKESETTIPMYESFVNTQAQLMISEVVLQRVADELADRNLDFFHPRNTVITIAQRLKIPMSLLEKLGLPTKPQLHNPVDLLQQGIVDEVIMVRSDRRSELIKVVVDLENRSEARILADAIMRAYMASEGSRSSQSDDTQLSILEEERRTLAEKIQRQQESIRQMAEQYGTAALSGRRDMMLDRVADLQKEKTRIEAKRIALEARVHLLENTQDSDTLPRQIVEREQQYINNDATVQALTQRLAQLEQELVVAQQSMTANNPQLQRTQTLLDAFRSRLEERREQLSQQFSEAIHQEGARTVTEELALAKAELEQTKAHEEILQRALDAENDATIALGRKQLTIEDQQKQLALNEQLYDTISKRIRELQVEQKRPGRISVAFEASTVPLANRRFQLTLGLIFGSLGLGLALAFLQTKRDQRVRSPEEIVWRIGVPILGTTVRDADRKHHSHLLADDYHTIRSNLGLRNEGDIPHKLAITSSGIGEGKTTLAINLATSLAATGQRILLIDGDFCKPDVARLLGITTNGESAADVLLGNKTFSDTVRSTCQPGLDLLPGYCRDSQQATEALNSSTAREAIASISQHYDHIIIDTPPILIGPMALLWAKLADGVVLSSMAGRTQYPELREAFDRLAELNVPVIGNVLSNVTSRHSYHRYGYYYRGSDKHTDRTTTKHNDREHLLISAPDAKQED